MSLRSDAIATPEAERAEDRRWPVVAIAAALIAVGSAGILLGAAFFQHVVGIPPCPLCLEQRMPHYVAAPIALIVAVLAWRQAPRAVVAAGFVALVLALLTTVGIGAYHAGVEWGFWVGPSDCSGEIQGFGHAGSLLQQMQSTSVIRCDEVQFRALGLSLAGWNVVMSAALAALAAWGLARTLRRPA
ncbi:disulfide bond formation protein B [Rhodoplanes sp. TEM]|uniref:Disulfide bond formation protein B n=1 Tax=Rhodoplanes tepidamans TaxID=200616 RepID=A0ABT5J5X9_RHOTP|nr:MULTISPECIES: disulfide bond formation protein B [Rhodoplanes]MDC7784445.1 disulfide bond formation protein B [Rhodoplanes tepidamans]MDC7983475.1 disulfide bond formation protein B [Rhodoplanes sp. TEM]MDQ0356952.1 disulfide bond formation protein DsbB [Rhodoplanes tepidamans]